MTDQPMSFHDGDVVVTTVYEEPTFLTVLRADSLDSGLTFWHVYRSIQFREDSPQADRLRELIAGTEPYGEPETVEGEMWMGGEAVVTTYLARKEKQGV